MSDQLISREALKKAICEKGIKGYEEYNQGLATALDLIDIAPTVDTYTIEDIQEVRENALILGAKLAQRPQGCWNEIQAGMFACPFCGARPHKDFKNFCAKCGADMRKGGAE